MVSRLITIALSKRFASRVRNGILGIIMAAFIATIMAPFFVELPKMELAIYGFVGWAQWLVGAGCLLLIPVTCQHLVNVKNGAPLFSRSSNYHEPWPVHTNPAARRTSWGGLDQENDVRGRQTKAILKSNGSAHLSITTLRQVIIVMVMLAGILLMALYPVTRSLVFEVTPPRIEALQKMTAVLWPLFVFWGLVIFVLGASQFRSQVTVARFDKSGNRVAYRTQRYFGWLNKLVKPNEKIASISNVAGIQIISYRARNTRQNKRLLDQYEMNLVFEDGQRCLVAKHSRHKTILQDAITIATYLECPVWDRSGYYRRDDPALLQPHNPVLQPL